MCVFSVLLCMVTFLQLHTRTHARTHARTIARMHARTHKHCIIAVLCVRMHIDIDVYKYIYIHKDTYTYTQIFKCSRISPVQRTHLLQHLSIQKKTVATPTETPATPIHAHETVQLRHSNKYIHTYIYIYKHTHAHTHTHTHRHAHTTRTHTHIEMPTKSS